jgi:hypothetical protein
MIELKEEIISEAPRERAREIHELLAGLQLPEGRLSRIDLERVVYALAQRPDLIDDLVVDDEINRWWFLLLREHNFEVRILSWETNQTSDWHDHGGSSGAFAVTAGTLVEQYRSSDHVAIETRQFGSGDIGSFGPDHVHDVDYVSGRPAVSVHAYSPPLRGLTFYDNTRFGFVAREFVLEEQRGS